MTDLQGLKKRADGLWSNIHSALIPHFNYAIEQTSKHVACPMHGGKDGFRFFPDVNKTGGGVCNTCGAFSDGFSILCWANDWTLPESVKQVADFLDNERTSNYQLVTGSKNVETEVEYDENKQRRIDNICKELVPVIDAVPSQKYLINRNVYQEFMDIPGDLKFHPALPYWHANEFIGNFPALVALVRDLNGDIISLHQTFITDEGMKADVPVVKKLLPPSIKGATTGCAIQLFPATEILILAEGVETALAMHLHLGMPAWSCISSGGLQRVVIPIGVKEIVIGADNDQNQVGQKAASILADRLLREDPERDIRILMPPEEGTDWLDVYNQTEASK